MSQDIFVVVEHLRGQVADISYVMLAAARVLAGGTGGKVVAILLGSDAERLAADLAADREHREYVRPGRAAGRFPTSRFVRER